MIGFVWQHILLVISLRDDVGSGFLSVRSALGSNVISTIPFVMELAGDAGMIPPLTIGEWTYVMNFILVGLQLLILAASLRAGAVFPASDRFFLAGSSTST